MARLHSFSDEAICAIMTRNSQPHRYGSSKQNQEAVRLIHEQYAIDRREQTELLTAALIEANPEPISAYRVLHTIRREREWCAAEIDTAISGWKRWRRAQREAAV
jgi:hypothetical protein